MEPPRLSAADREAGLAKALEMRRLRAELRQRIKEGEVSAAQILSNTLDDAARSMRISVLLESLPGIGPVTARRMMKRIGISPTRKVQGLGERQRRLLLGELVGVERRQGGGQHQKPGARG